MTIPALFKRLASYCQRIVLLILLPSALFLLSSTPSHAQTTMPVNNQASQPNPYMNANTNPDVPKNLHTWTQNVMLEVMSAMVCQLAGIDPTNGNQKCLGVDQKSGKIGFVEGGGGAIGLMGNMIAVLYTPPVHTSDYLAYLGENFGIAKPAHAQTGAGFIGLNPLQNIWASFRDMVYILFVIVFVIIGFAIMLRIKIDPRTVMTVENQIPKIIIGILLVTFSFAIAGLLIDLMWVSIYVVANMLGPATNDPNAINTTVVQKISEPPLGFTNELFNRGTGGILNIAWDSAWSIKQAIQSLFTGEIKNPLDILLLPELAPQQTLADCTGFDPKCWVGNIVGQAVGGTIGGVLSNVAGWAISWLVGILGILVVLIALFWALLRLWFTLLMAFIYLLIDIVLAPLWILGGLIPGAPVSFGAWLRDMLGNLAAFPATLGLFLLGRVFMDAFGAAGSKSLIFPFIGNLGDPKQLGALVGLGIILIAPQVVRMTRDAFKSPEFKYAAAIGQAVGFGAGVPGGLAGAGTDIVFGTRYREGIVKETRGGVLGILARLARVYR